MRNRDCAIIAAFASLSTLLAADDASNEMLRRYQAQAIRLFPELAKEGSDLNVQFKKEYEFSSAFAPAELASTDWPVVLAKRAAEHLRSANAEKRGKSVAGQVTQSEELSANAEAIIAGKAKRAEMFISSASPAKRAEYERDIAEGKKLESLKLVRRGRELAIQVQRITGKPVVLSEGDPAKLKAEIQGMEKVVQAEQWKQLQQGAAEFQQRRQDEQAEWERAQKERQQAFELDQLRQQNQRLEQERRMQR